jgi:hypothetical protein
MKTSKTEIAKIVKQTNDLNHVASVNINSLHESLKGYLGSKTTKKDHSMLKSVEIIPLADIPVKPYKEGDYASVHAWLDISPYSIWLKVKINYNGGNTDNYNDKDDPYYCDYVDESYYIASLDNHVLTELHTESTLSELKDLDADAINDLYNTAYDAAVAYKKAVKSIPVQRIQSIVETVTDNSKCRTCSWNDIETSTVFYRLAI